jgi:hypothetical protein
VIRSGGLFSDAVMPEIEDEIYDPDVFFTLPNIISRLSEELSLGNGTRLERLTGIPVKTLESLLLSVPGGALQDLKRLRIALGVTRAKLIS